MAEGNLKRGVLRACIFDLDGVLVDTAVYHYQAWKRLANELGFDFTEDQNEQLKGISRMDSLNRILDWGGVKISDANKQQLATKKNHWYVKMISNMKTEEVLPGSRELLELIRESGLKCALGSASRNSSLILDCTGLSSYFDAIVDGNLVTASKPDPQVFLKGAELLGTDPRDCVVFEDAVAGVQAARAAGMRIVGIGNEGVLDQADLVVSGLDMINLNRLTELFNQEP